MHHYREVIMRRTLFAAIVLCAVLAAMFWSPNLCGAA